jgi:hypothetical protein
MRSAMLLYICAVCVLWHRITLSRELVHTFGSMATTFGYCNFRCTASSLPHDQLRPVQGAAVVLQLSERLQSTFLGLDHFT